MPPVVVEAGPRELRVAVFRRAARTLEIREYHAVPLPPGTFALGPLGGPVADAAALEAAAGALVERLSTRHPRASLVLPDAWARGMTVELSEIPASPELALEVLRFRIRKMVPFRVEELRLSASPIVKLEQQEEAVRALVLLAAEGVCAALERAFDRHGMRIGQIVNSSLARLGAVAAGGRLPGLAALATVEEHGFTLLFARDGAPVLWRQKSFTEGLEDPDRARLMAAELRLTRTFLAERLAGETISAALLAAAPAVEPFWREVLEAGLERPVATLALAHLPLADDAPAMPAAELATLAGAACREVAA